MMNNGVPDLLQKKYNQFKVLGIIIAIVGTLLTMALRSSSANFFGIIFPFIIGSCLFAYAKYKEYTIKKKGYYTITGECFEYVDHLAFLPGRKYGKNGNGFLIDSSEGIIYVPVGDKKMLPAINLDVQLYILNGSQKHVDSKNIVHYTDILGFSLGISEK